MGWSLDAIAALYLGIPSVAFLVAGGLTYWIYTQAWDRREARWFVVMLGAGMVLGLLHLSYLLAATPAVMEGLLFAQLVAAFVAFSLFVVFASVYTDRNFHQRWPIQAGLLVTVGGMVVLAATEWGFDHGLLLAERVPTTDPFPYIQNEPGVGFAALVVVLVAMLGYSWFVLVSHLLTTQHRGGLQMVLVLLAGLSVALTEVLGRLGVFPVDGFHYALWGLAPFVVLSAIALFRLRLFDVQPVARTVVVETLHDPILIVDREGRLVDYNRASSRLWPSIDALVGRPFEGVSDALAASLEVPPVNSTAERTERLTLSGVDGRDRHFSVTVTPVRRRHSDDVGWYAILLRDVTDIERSRRQLELQNERLDQVSSTISHDLRNPIQVADGFTDLAIDDLDGLADEEPAAAEALSKLERVGGAVDRMDEIVENVLALAREGRAVEDPEPVELAAAAREAWANVDTGDADLVVDVEDTWSLEADRRRLLSILENLFRNSVEHGSTSSRSSADDSIEHAGPAVTVTVERTEEGFAVADDGPGIPADQTDTVFQYGYSTEAEATGFGLAIVRTMAESHGWTVSVDDHDGARFVFDLDPATLIEGSEVGLEPDGD